MLHCKQKTTQKVIPNQLLQPNPTNNQRYNYPQCLKYADIISDPLLLVLRYTLGDPRDISNFLFRQSVSALW